jgi:hypothetical protein
MRAKELMRAVIWCWLLGFAFFGARWGVTSAPQPRNDKGARAGASHPWYWRELPQALAISPDGKWLWVPAWCAMIVGGAGCGLPCGF